MITQFIRRATEVTRMHLATVRTGRPSHMESTHSNGGAATVTQSNVPLLATRIVPFRVQSGGSRPGERRLEGGRGMDVIEAYRRSLAGFAETVRQVRPDQWDQPTPCPDWNVRALVNHVVSEELWSVPLLSGATVADVGDRFDGDLLGADPTAAGEDAVRQAEAAVDEPGVLSRTVHLSFGDFPAEEYLRQLLADHLI